jgi:hypothetical protein
LLDLQLVGEGENRSLATDADHQRAQQRTELVDPLDGLLLKIGLNDDGERDRQEIAVFMNLLRDAVVVELEVGGGESVDEVAGAIGDGGGRDD